MPLRNLPASTGRPSAASGARSSWRSGARGGEEQCAFLEKGGLSVCSANGSSKVRFLGFALILPKSWPRFPLPLGDVGCPSVRSNPFHPSACPSEHSSAPCDGRSSDKRLGRGEAWGSLAGGGSFLLDRRPLVRALLASAAIAAALALAGCDTDGTTAVNGRHMQPLSDRMQAEIESKNMAKESPILVRIFKEESEFEVWKQDKSGRFALLNTYPICRWSGELGPKIKQGDRQAPEGFYTITPGLMNPNSNYYLAINTGFPNAYDRANGRTGAFLMIHGDCSSAGCYAMTDEQIAEIYALARESFFGGQRSFQIQAYPFRMTPLNMAKHRNSPHMAFWKMLKEGYDYFEVTRAEP